MKRMKTYWLMCLSMIMAMVVSAQQIPEVAPVQSRSVLIWNATAHLGDGNRVDQAAIGFRNGKIDLVAPTSNADKTKYEVVIDATGMHVYPGFIASNSTLGLMEIDQVRATVDLEETGTYKPSMRSAIAYNTDSEIIPTVRSNGVLTGQIVPRGGVISGTSSVMQFDAWNWEDAAYDMDGRMHLNMPSLVARPNRFAAFFGQDSRQGTDAVKEAFARIEEIKQFFREAKAYHAEAKHEKINLKFEATKKLFDKKQKLFVHCDLVKEMLVAIDFVKEFGFEVVIVGGSEGWQIPELLKQHNIAVLLNQSHSLPTTQDDDVDLPYKTAAILHKAGVLVAINDEDGQTRGMNLPFNAGTAAAYGMGKEAALSAITLNAAKVLGIDQRTGSIETGKDANIVISDGDILDMKSSVIRHAFIQGRQISLESKHTHLNDRYRHKYGIK